MAPLLRIILGLIGVLFAAGLLPHAVWAGAPPPGSTVNIGENKGRTSYSATVAATNQGVWISVHARGSYSGTYVATGYRSTSSFAPGTSPAAYYSQAGSGAGSSSASNVTRSWTNAAGEPYYETTTGQVYHLAGINIGTASEGPQGWFTVGMHQHPGTVPEALYVNGNLQGIVWVPIGAGGVHWGTPPTGAANGQASAPIVVDPRAVAMDVLRRVPLPSLRIRENPSLGMVALPGWFWGEGYNGQPFGGSAGIGALTVAVQVQPTSYTWSFGDGTTLVSQDLGQPYPAESDIKHTYQYSSLHYPNGFPVSLTVQFAASYTVNGGHVEPLATLAQTYTAAYRVQELQSILTSR